MYHKNIEHRLPISMEKFARAHNLPMWTVYGHMRKGYCAWPRSARNRTVKKSKYDKIAREFGMSVWSIVKKPIDYDALVNRAILKNISFSCLYGLTLVEFRLLFSETRLHMKAIVRHIVAGTIEKYIETIHNRVYAYIYV